MVYIALTRHTNICLTIGKFTPDAVTNCILTLELSVDLVLAILTTVVVTSETDEPKSNSFGGNSTHH